MLWEGGDAKDKRTLKLTKVKKARMGNIVAIIWKKMDVDINVTLGELDEEFNLTIFIAYKILIEIFNPV